MSPLQFKFFSALTVIHLVLVFGPHSVKADFSDSCVNSTNSTSCSRTYEHVYNSLAKSENSFNIESALYPAKKPSSVRVFVNVYAAGPNKTKDSAPIAKYTWSISCLYVAVPDTVLGILSLGSILVDPHTQNLSIQIPLFCCNVSEKEDERRKIIKEMIEGALAALQDLAISPGIRDPRLNTAECVIEGHEMDIDATGRKHYIRTILWLPVFFVFVSCPLLANFLEDYGLAWPTTKKNKKTNKNNDRKGNNRQSSRNQPIQENRIQEHDSQEKEEKNKNKKNTAAAVTVCILSFVLAVIGSLILLIAWGFSISYWDCARENASDHIVFIIPSILIVVSLIVFGFRKWQLDGVSWYSIFFTICANVTSYHSCWLLIGIMINPTWGLTVTLLACFTFAAIGFAVYEYNNEISKDPRQFLNKDTCQEKSSNKCQSFLLCGCLVLSAILFVVIVILAGQSYNGRETVDESLKTALLSVIGVLVSWVSWKRHIHATHHSVKHGLTSAQIELQPFIEPDSELNISVKFKKGKQPLQNPQGTPIQK